VSARALSVVTWSLALVACGGSDAEQPGAAPDAVTSQDALVDAPGCTESGVGECPCTPVAPGASGRFATAHLLLDLVADPVRCRVYGLTSSAIVVFDVGLKRELTTIALPDGATDLDVAPDGSVLVTGHRPMLQVAVVDPVVRAVTRTIPTTADPYRVETDGRRAFYVTMDQWSDAHRIELQTGVDTTLDDGIAYQPDIELSADGRLLYVGASATSSAELYTFGVAEDAFGMIDRSNRDGQGLPISGPIRHVVLSPDGERVYYGGLQLDAAWVSTSHGTIDDKVLAESSLARIAVGAARAWDATSRQPLRTHPAPVSMAAFVAEDQELWAYLPGSREIWYVASADLRDAP